MYVVILGHDAAVVFWKVWKNSSYIYGVSLVCIQNNEVNVICFAAVVAIFVEISSQVSYSFEKLLHSLFKSGLS